eukprot:752581-Hanusia_phi.AAC.3
MYLFHSLSQEELVDPEDLRKKLLQFFYRFKGKESLHRPACDPKFNDLLEKLRQANYHAVLFEIPYQRTSRNITVIEVKSETSTSVALVIQSKSEQLIDLDEQHNCCCMLARTGWVVTVLISSRLKEEAYFAEIVEFLQHHKVSTHILDEVVAEDVLHVSMQDKSEQIMTESDSGKRKREESDSKKAEKGVVTRRPRVDENNDYDKLSSKDKVMTGTASTAAAADVNCIECHNEPAEGEGKDPQETESD